jgi:type IV pilus assembly protein PilM
LAIDLAALARRVVGAGAVPPPPHVVALSEREVVYSRIAPGAGAVHELRELRRVELPPDTFAAGLLGGPLRDAPAFADRLGQLLAGLSAPVDEASLVLPDAWLRVTFVESGDLPRTADTRDEVVRWKVKRLLPFRVEDLRLAWAEVPPLPLQSEPRRLLVAFGLESLLAGLEDAFAARGVWIGRITAESLALLPAVAPALSAAPLGALANVHSAGYTLLFTRHGVPVLYRFRALDPGLGDAQRASTVARDLRLTRAFVAEQLPDETLGRMVLAAPAPEVARWQAFLGEGLGRAAEPLEGLGLPLTAAERVTWVEVAPMLGAAREEVA